MKYILLFLLLLPTPCLALKFTAVEKNAIENTQQGVINLNNKFGDFNTQLSALSGNALAIKNDVSALSGNVVDLRIQLQNSISAFNNAQLNLSAKVAALDKSINAGRDINQNKSNDVGIFYAIIGVMGLIICLLVYWDKRRDSEVLAATSQSKEEYKKLVLEILRKTNA